MEITYQHLTQQQIGPELFSGFDRWQNVTRCWRKENGSWVLRDISFIDDWNEEEYTFLYDCLKNTLNTGGDVIAAWRAIVCSALPRWKINRLVRKMSTFSCPACTFPTGCVVTASAPTCLP